MKKPLKTISILTLTAMLLLSMAFIIRPAKAQTTVLYVDPPLSIFYSNVTSSGDDFTVLIQVANVTDLFAYEFKLMWDNTTLDGISAVRPAGHFLEPELNPGNEFVPVWKKIEVDATHEAWHLGYTLLAPETGRTGSGVLVELTFKILKDPPWKGMVSSPLDLYDTKLSNTVPEAIPHDALDGTFEFHWAPPTIYPYLSVEPTTTTITAGPPIVNTTDAFFDIQVWINNVEEDWWLIGAEFKLAYNATLINYTSIAIDPWLEAFGDIYMVPVAEGVRGDGLAYIHTAVVLLPHDYPPSEWWWPISGTGALVTITFEVLMQEEFPWTAESPLDLYDIKFSDINAESVPQAPEEDGNVIIEGFIVGRSIDVYTQYPNSFGGQGPRKPSDAFAPQNEVILYALVQYNLDPVQNKPVDFEVKWPSGEVLLTRQAFTDIDGIACINFRIPWPDQVTPENVFGIWNVTVTCEIADVVVNDTLTFEVTWLMEIISIETAEEFQKQKPGPLGEMWFKVCWEVRSAIERPAVITVVVYDDLDVPIAWGYYEGNFSANDIFDPAPYCYNFTLYIPTWAYVGPATVYANIFTDFPQNGGVSYGPEKSAEFRILKP